MSFIPSPPNFPFIKFGINDIDLSALPPEHIQSFSYTRSTKSETGTGNQLEITVFDSTAITMEYLIAKAGTQVFTFSYGYENGPQSPVYQMKISDYNIDFSNTGSTVSITAVSQGLADSVSKPKATSYSGMLISDIVKKIASEEGWIVKADSIEPTKPVYEDDGKDSKNSSASKNSQKKLKTFTRSNQSAPQFINQVLSKYAISASTGQGDYKLWFDDTANDEGKSTVYYKPNQYNSTQDTTSMELKYQFKYGVGSNSTVLDFQPEFKSALVAAAGGATIKADMLNRVKNSIITVDFSSQTAKNRPTTGDAQVDRTLNTFNFAGSAYSKEELENIAASMWYMMASQSYPATLQIVGDPSVEVQEECSVLMMMPNGVPHHSSGVYLITKIVDSIEGGNYTTELSLTRNALTVSADEGGTGINITVQPVTTSSKDDDSSSSDTASNGDVEKALQWMKKIADDNSHGYSQANRWGPDYDCSSFVISGFKSAGFNVGKATYTGDMRAVFVKAGFKWISPCPSMDKLKRGDILLNESRHVEVYWGGGKNIGAHSNYDGRTGDSGGREIRIGDYWNDNWGGVLRYDK